MGGDCSERVRGAHMVKELSEVAQGGSRCLRLLLGRAASPRGLPDLINHILLLSEDAAAIAVRYSRMRVARTSSTSRFFCGPRHVAAEVMFWRSKRNPKKSIATDDTGL